MTYFGFTLVNGKGNSNESAIWIDCKLRFNNELLIQIIHS